VAVRVKKDDNAEGTNDAVGAGADSDDEDGMEMIVESGPKSGGGDEKDPNEDGSAAAKDGERDQVETSEVNTDKVIGGAWG
jgi:hypothetical protein